MDPIHVNKTSKYVAPTYAQSRKYHTPIDFDAYREWHARQGSPVRTECAEVLSQDRTLTIDSAEAEFPPTDSSLRVPGLPGRDSAASTEPGVGEPPAPYPVSFSQIVELITAGQQVPGIKEVPDTLLEGQASRAVKAKRRKPWETELEERDVEAIGDAVGKGPVYL